MKIIYVVDETSFFLPNILKELINQKKNLHKLVIIIKKVPKKACIKSYLINNFYYLNFFELLKLSLLTIQNNFIKFFRVSYFTNNFYSIEQLCIKKKINYIKIYDDINKSSTVEIIKKIKADVLVNMGSHLLKENILNSTKYGCINRHTSELPKYKGLLPVFYALKNKDDHVAISFHKINSKIDEGKILSQKKILVAKEDTVFSIYAKTSEESSAVCNDALNNLIKNKIIENNHKASYFSWPNKDDWKIFRANNRKFI